jgi:hypothetical protein
VATNKKACERLINLLKGDKSNPLFLGYEGSAVMMMAKYVFNPLKKLSDFKKGKAMLNKAVKADKNNLELRFLRLMAEVKTPSFLGYNDHIKSDKKQVIYLLSKTKNKELKQFIIPKLKRLGIFAKSNFHNLD